MGANPVPAVVPIPPLTPSGVLPPYLGTDPAVRGAMSPYRVTLTELVQRFAHTAERRTILAGFLAHRAILIGFGVTGIQWLDGSFLEDIERVASRSDIDVVSFFVRPPAYQRNHVAWDAFWRGHMAVFNSQMAKTTYHTDAYFVDVEFGAGPVIQQTAYWFGLFSHKRATGLWKGMLEVQLDSQQDDATATQLLSTM
jgi:hypothetical protein